MRHALLLVALVAVWVALAGEVTVPVLVLAAALGAVAMLVFRSLIDGPKWLGRSETIAASPADRGSAFERGRRHLVRLGVMLAFLPVFLWKVLVSGVQMAFLALKPSLDFWPGIVRVHGGMRTVTGTTMFGSVITLTPGTLTLAYDEENDDLYVHWIDITGYGEEEFDRQVTSNLRVWLERMDV